MRTQARLGCIFERGMSTSNDKSKLAIILSKKGLFLECAKSFILRDSSGWSCRQEMGGAVRMQNAPSQAEDFNLHGGK